MEYGLIGNPLGHSLSPVLHAAFGGYSYELIELPPERVGDFLSRREFRGINVTVPYKRTVLPYLDEIDGAARAIGAVNTVLNRDGKRIGFNTDLFGMDTLLRRWNGDLSGKTAAILGSGGTAHTAAFLLLSRGAKNVTVVSRDPEKTKNEGKFPLSVRICGYDALFAEGGAQVLINTTPVGMFPRSNECPVDLSRLPLTEAVFDAVYRPVETVLVRTAKARGLFAEGGLRMLIAQGAEASRLFTGRTVPTQVCETLFRKLSGEKERG